MLPRNSDIVYLNITAWIPADDYFILIGFKLFNNSIMELYQDTQHYLPPNGREF
jgi:hypothetical protein